MNKMCHFSWIKWEAKPFATHKCKWD